MTGKLFCDGCGEEILSSGTWFEVLPQGDKIIYFADTTVESGYDVHGAACMELLAHKIQRESSA